MTETSQISGQAEAHEAALHALALSELLRQALIEQQDNAPVVDLAAWKEAGLISVLRPAHALSGQMLKRLEQLDR